jgi:hypothetical protein
MRCQRQKGLDPGDVKSELASIPWIIRALKYGGVVTKIESVVAARDHQGPMPTRNFGSDHCDTVEQQRELSSEGFPVHLGGEAVVECLRPKALRCDKRRDPAAVLGGEGRQLALVNHALQDWRGLRLDFLKPVLEGYGFAIDLKVIEAFLGRRLSWCWLGDLIGMDVGGKIPARRGRQNS